MKTSKKIALITAGACLVLGAAVSVSAFASMDFDFNKLDTVKKVTNEVVIEDNFNSINIDDSSSDIKILPSTDNKCRIEFYEYLNESHTTKIENNTLYIECEDGGSWMNHFHLFNFRSPYVEVHLPEKEYNSLNIKISSGDITVDESFSFKNADCECSSGDIDFYADADILDVQTTSGDVKLSGVKADTINTNCTSGDMTTNGVQCKSISAQCTSGDIELKSVVSSGGFMVQTSSGDIELKACDGQKIELEASSGDIEGSLLTEKRFHAESSSGDVSTPANDSPTKSECRAKTSSGDIVLWIGNEN